MIEKQLNVLLVDDDHDYLNSLADIIKLIESDVNIITAASGEQVLDILNGTHEFDLILLDQILQNERGIDLVKKIHNFNSKIRVVLCTGIYSQNRDLVEEETAYLVLTKPCGKSQLKTLLKNIRAEEELKVGQQKQQITSEIVLAIQKATDIETVSKLTLEGLIELGFDRARLYFLDRNDQDEQVLIGKMSAGMGMKNSFNEFVIRTKDVPFVEGLLRDNHNPQVIKLSGYEDKEWFRYLELLGIQEIIECPLFIGNTTIGMITVDNRVSKRPFPDFIIKLIYYVISHFCQAYANLENQRKLRSVVELSREISNNLIFKEKLRIACNIICGSINAEMCNIFVYDKTNKLLARSGSNVRGYSPRKLPFDEEYREGIVWNALTSAAPIIDNRTSNGDVERNDKLARYKEVLPSKNIMHQLLIPLVYNSEAVGVVRVVNKLEIDDNIKPADEIVYSRIGFAREDTKYIESFGYQLASLISSHEYYEDFRTGKDQLEWLEGLSAEITKSVGDFDLLSFLALTGITIKDGLRFNRAALFLYDETEGVIKGERGIGPRTEKEATQVYEDGYWQLSHSFKELRALYDSKKGDVWLNNWDNYIRTKSYSVSQVPAFVRASLPSDLIVQSTQGNTTDEFIKEVDAQEFVIVPLKVEEAILGYIYVDRKFDGRRITDTSLKILQLFANTVAVALKIRRQARENEENYYNISHDLGSKINIISKSAEYLKELWSGETRSVDLIHKSQKYIDQMYRQDKSLRLAIQFLLKFRQFQDGTLSLEIKKMFLTRLVKDVLEDYSILLEEKHNTYEAQYLIDEETPFFGDMNLLKIALGSIVDNAIKFSPKDLPICSVVRHGKGNLVVIEIINHGPKIPPDELIQLGKKTFKGKYSRDASMEGSGRGIMLANAIINLHKGILDYKSTDDGETTATISFPL